MSHLRTNGSSTTMRTKNSEESLNDESDDRDLKRKCRNLSEKKRRDQFNILVNELSNIVATGGKKMDKSTVLKTTISILKKHNEKSVRRQANEIQEDWKPNYLSNEEFIHLVLEAVYGFIMIVAQDGKILYTSESIATVLGHLPKKVLNMTLYDLANAEEYETISTILQNPSFEEDNQISFSCHLRRGGIKNCDEYELKIPKEMEEYPKKTSTQPTTQRALFFATGRLETPLLYNEVPIDESCSGEFTSRFSLEWKFLYLDDRAAPIIGYKPFELLGNSGYDYYHVDDLVDIVKSHEELMEKGEGTSCNYRFLTKGQQWIWMQTSCYISYHQWNSKPEYVVCTNRIVSYMNGMRRKSSTEGKENNLYLEKKERPKPSTKTRPDSLYNYTVIQQDDYFKTSLDEQQITKSEDSPQIQLLSHLIPEQQQQQLSEADKFQIPLNTPNTNQFYESPLQYSPDNAIISSSIIMEEMQSFTPIAQSMEVLYDAAQPLSHCIGIQDQTQLDLERKQAELEALINQQQAELRRVSEQLILARGGILTPQTQQNQSTSMYDQGTQNSMTTFSNGTGVPIITTINSTTDTVQSCFESTLHSIAEPPPPPDEALTALHNQESHSLMYLDTDIHQVLFNCDDYNFADIN